jgi:SPP1 family phage portal protein
MEFNSLSKEVKKMEFINNVNMLTTPELIKIYIDEFEASEERALMLAGDRYYRVKNDILQRKMYRYENEQKVEDETKPNHKLAHGFMHEFVDDKVNYLLVKPYTMECKDEKYLKRVQDILGKRYQHRLVQLGTETSNKGIAWTYEYINSSGEKKTMKVPAEQCIPWWTDNENEELDAMIRYYQVEVYEGKSKKLITKIEMHYPDGVEYYEQITSGEIILDAEKYLNADDNGGIRLPHFKINNQPGSWERVPFVPWKNNDFELPDLQFVKTLVDEYDISRSDVGNMLEIVKQLIYILRGYGGQSLSEFVRNLAYYDAINLDADEHSGVDKLEHTVNIDAADKHYQQLLKDIYRFAQAVDKGQDKLGNSPSGIALKFLYSGLDLKDNALEDSFKWSFEQQMYFINKYLEVTNKGTVSDKEINIVFNRDIAINESAAITDCQNSMGVISQQTIIENHPWTKDYKTEKAQMDKEAKSQEVPLLGEDEDGEDGEE